MRATLESIRARIAARQGFVRSVGTLAGGTAIAQGLAILALPILTRLYTPSEFSVLAVYASLLATLSVAACLRLEIAIPIPEREEDAASLLALALASSAITALLVGATILLFQRWISTRLGVPALEPYLWMVPLGVWIASTYAAVQHWSTRKKTFQRIARTRIAQAIGGVGTQIGAGVVGLGSFGLLLGHMISGGLGVFALARDALTENRNALESVSRKGMCRMLRRYSRFPKYSALEALANTAGSQLPVILIASLSAGPEAGYLMLATRAMAVPLGLIGGAVAQVYLSRAAEDLRLGRLPETTARIFGGLVKTGVGPLLFAAIIAAPVFALVFGEEWRRSGVLVAWLAPWSILQFLGSPVSMVMHVQMRQRSMLLLTASGLALRVGAVLVAAKTAPSQLVEFYAVAAAIYYLVLSVVFYKVAGVGAKLLLRETRRNAVFPAVWLLFAMVAWATLEWV